MRVGLVATAVCLSAIGVSVASDAEAAIRKSTHIAAQGLGPALQMLAKERDFQIVYLSDAIDTLRTNGAVGELTADEALTKLLEGTGFSYRYLGERAVTIVPVATGSGEGATPGPLEIQSPPATRGEETSAHGGGRKSFWQRLRLAQAETSSQSQELKPSEGSSRNSQKRIELEEIVVTGTHIRGVKDQFSPVLSIGRDDMDLAGHSSVSDVFESLPQNFANVSPETIGAADSRGPGAAGINLHGLGAEATLTLLNGRRLPGGGSAGTFADISTIPTSAIERIEILTDGASAIYGSEAIAGVANIILRDDFDGAESRLGLSAVTDGGGQAIRFGQTAGFSRERVHGLVIYEYSSEEELDINDKGFVRARRPTIQNPNYLAPFSEKHSLIASGGAELSNRISLSADGYYNQRESESFSTNGTAAAPLQALHTPKAKQFGGSVGVNARLFGDWEGDLSGAYARGDYNSRTTRLDSNPGGNFPSRFDNYYRLWSADASIGGSLFHVVGAPVRTVLGAHYRSELLDLDQQLSSLPLTRRTDKREVFAAYGELYAPLVTEANAVPGVGRLAVTIAARYDDYSDAGSSFNPKIGVAWSPASGLNLRGTWSKSFRPPFMFEFRPGTNTNLGIYIDPQSSTGFSPALQVTGRRSGLGPETAESWTAGFDFTPDSLKGFRLRATYFDVDYTDRLGAPSVRLDSLLRFTNFTGTPLRDVSLELVQSLVDQSVLFQDFSASSTPITLADVTVILDTRIQNISSSRLNGVDLEIAYERPTDFGDWAVSLNGTLLNTLEQQVTPLTVVNDLLDTFGNPVDLRVRGGITWQTAPATAALFVNYVDGYTDSAAVGGPVPIDPWTTIDVSVRFDLDEIFGGGFAKGSSLSLSATNLLNEDPPAIGARVATSTTTFDSSNASPAGRKIGLLLMKRW